jgi:hypothetical protein
MIYDAFAHLPKRVPSSPSATPLPAASCRSTQMPAAFPICIPACTACTHCRRACQTRGIALAQIPDANISVCHGAGGMFAASGTIIMSNEAP